MLVHQILKSKGDDGVVSVRPDVTIKEVTRILAERRIGGVVVSQDGQTAQGILSERDIVRALAQRGPEILEERAEQMMTADPETCKRDDNAHDVLSRMTEGRFRHMPVVEDGVLVGIVTIGDAVKARLSELAMENNALEGMIMGH
ncbi:CBS domain-containing protein [Aquicoccus sp. SCR17]|nr:CBS domain-containing protein [Carideicomes alvinocaridis]